MKRFLIAGVAALLLGGCGGVESQEPVAQDEQLESTEQGLIYPCPYSSSYMRAWFENGVEVGYETCSCDGTLTKYGKTRGQYQQTLTGYCN
jgi:hypothetical protein